MPYGITRSVTCHPAEVFSSLYVTHRAVAVWLNVSIFVFFCKFHTCLLLLFIFGFVLASAICRLRVKLLTVYRVVIVTWVAICLSVRSEKPTEVRLGIYVNSFYSISEQTMVRRRISSLLPRDASYLWCGVCDGAVSVSLRVCHY